MAARGSGGWRGGRGGQAVAQIIGPRPWGGQPGSRCRVNRYLTPSLAIVEHAVGQAGHEEARAEFDGLVVNVLR